MNDLIRELKQIARTKNPHNDAYILGRKQLAKYLIEKYEHTNSNNRLEGTTN